MKIRHINEELSRALNEENVQTTGAFIRYNQEDIDEGLLWFNSLEELLKETTQFYHDTFAPSEFDLDNDMGDDDYDENKEYTDLLDAIDLWEGNGYGIAQVLKGRY